ncbi:MAG: hypothetical protein GF308_19270 [Candidatus Heimdallarchaeota archaeon]|nr:hypothetical protein [Candidatus Heimdallarchaeota archaeon]
MGNIDQFRLTHIGHSSMGLPVGSAHPRVGSELKSSSNSPVFVQNSKGILK